MIYLIQISWPSSKDILIQQGLKRFNLCCWYFHYEFKRYSNTTRIETLGRESIPMLAMQFKRYSNTTRIETVCDLLMGLRVEFKRYSNTTRIETKPSSQCGSFIGRFKRYSNTTRIETDRWPVCCIRRHVQKIF